MECLDNGDGDGPYCGHSEQCVMRNLWKRLQDSMEEVLDNTTLESLRQDALRLKGDE